MINQFLPGRAQCTSHGRSLSTSAVPCPGGTTAHSQGSAGEEPTVWGGVRAHEPAAAPPCAGVRAETVSTQVGGFLI